MEKGPKIATDAIGLIKNKLIEQYGDHLEKSCVNQDEGDYLQGTIRVDECYMSGAR